MPNNGSKSEFFAAARVKTGVFDIDVGLATDVSRLISQFNNVNDSHASGEFLSVRSMIYAIDFHQDYAGVDRIRC
jgi:hypothetical protein